MPAWNLGDIMSNATVALGNRADIALSTASFWANEAYEQVWNDLPFDEEEALAISSTTVNEDKITLPIDFQELTFLSNLSRSNTLLDPLNADQLGAFSSSASGIPTHFILYSTWLELRPTPDSSYSLELRYKKQRSELTATTDIPSISTRFRRAVMLKTAELLAENVTLDDERAGRFRANYISYIESTPDDASLRVRSQHALGLSLGRQRGQVDRLTSRTSFDRRID